MLLFGQEPIKASYHPTNFGDHSHCGRGIIIILVCHVISQDHVIKGSSEFMGRYPSWKVTTLPSLVAIGMQCCNGNIFLVVQGQEITYPCFNPPLLFISKTHDIACSHIRIFRTQTGKDSYKHLNTTKSGKVIFSSHFAAAIFKFQRFIFQGIQQMDVKKNLQVKKQQIYFLTINFPERYSQGKLCFA